MLILAIDTSTEQAGLALIDGNLLRAEWSWTAAGNHSHHLHQLIQSMLETERVELRHLGAVVVAIGPGSFSGLRVGVSYAKGLAFALGVPLAGVPTLDVIALMGLFLSGDVLASISAGREQLYVGRYRGDAEHFERTNDYAIMLPGEAADLTGSETMLCGPGAPKIAAELSRQGRPAREEPAPWCLRRPGFLAELGRRSLAAGTEDQVHTLEPLYIRQSAAEERRLAREE